MTKPKIKNDWELMLEVRHSYFPHINVTDHDMAVVTHCPQCGTDMMYRGFSRMEDKEEEWAFAICIPCKVAFSF